MDIFDVLKLIGGLCLFLFGMNLMGAALEKRAGDGLKTILERMTTGKAAGFFTGLGITAIIQSSSATTVMVVGFVNSGIMGLTQAINVIMGANVGTTVTSWLLSLTGIESGNFFIQLLKPSSFTPVLALVGIVLYMGFKDHKKQDTATILLGFATLMFGMETMSQAVEGLSQVEAFRNILTMFSNPILGVLAGAVLTAIIQSSSASVGILQALSATGQITMGAAVPIIMGQNIGTCVTAMLSSVGANRNARRASVVHLAFNVIGTAALLVLFMLAQQIFNLSGFVQSAASEFEIAIIHTVFNISCTALLLPASKMLEKLSYKLIPEPKAKQQETVTELDERLMATPAIALEQCRIMTCNMAEVAQRALKKSLALLRDYHSEEADAILQDEAMADHYEDILGSYLVKLSTYPLSDKDSREAAKLLHVIGDLERISDHAVNILESAQELKEKDLSFSEAAQRELSALLGAVEESLKWAVEALIQGNLSAAVLVEPLEEIVDVLKDTLRSHHIKRMQKGECTIEMGFVWSDLITNLERVSDHCSNIAGCVLEMSHDSLELHRYLGLVKKDDPEFKETYRHYQEKYLKPLES